MARLIHTTRGMRTAHHSRDISFVGSFPLF
jgi:hypothetical protein